MTIKPGDDVICISSMADFYEKDLSALKRGKITIGKYYTVLDYRSNPGTDYGRIPEPIIQIITDDMERWWLKASAFSRMPELPLPDWF